MIISRTQHIEMLLFVCCSIKLVDMDLYVCDYNMYNVYFSFLYNCVLTLCH